MIGIIGAMEEEVLKLKDQMEDVEITSYASMDFYKGSLYGKNVVVVRSGIGKVNAAICTQILVDQFKITRVINTGIAGSLDSSIAVGDIVLSTDTLQHDMDATGFGYELGVIPRMETSTFHADQTLIDIAEKACQSVNPDIKVRKGRIVSGDQFISDKKKKDWLISVFSPMCTEMEGAAIAQTAYLNQIPFLIIRAISDSADGNANIDYKEFEGMAIIHSVNLVTELIHQID